LLVCFAWGLVGSHRVLHQSRYCPPATPADVDLPWEKLALQTADHLSIAGWLIRSPHPHPVGTLLLLHGFGTCKADLLDLAKDLHQGGLFHLVLIDFRAHGESGGNTFSYGKAELLDLEAVLNFLSGEPSLRRFPVGVLGISMGGAIGIQAAARFPQIRGVVADSTYADLAKAIARTQWMAYHIPRIPLGQVVIWATAGRLRCRLSTLSPIAVVGKIAPRPLLIIHGMKDKWILPAEAQALFQAAGEPKAFWLVPEAEHVGSFYTDREEYIRRVEEFFQDAFSRAA
jgi:pimeloyl-ACP methyl ester carboxylesterase